jgi:hypothetical protein
MERIELYRDEDLKRIQVRHKRTCIATIVVAAAGLMLCILFCILTTRKNQGVMLPLTIGTSILTGWTVITLSITLLDAEKAAIRHAKKIAEGEKETFEGRVEKTDELWHIRKGVSVRKVRVTADGRETVLNVSEALSKRLPDAFTGKVDVVYDFIVAYEVKADD